MTDQNIWEKHADETIVGPRKARLRAIDKRRQKKLDDRDTLFLMWLKWHQERKEQLMAGPYQQVAQLLADFLVAMTLDDGDRLIEMLCAGPWTAADRETKFLVLGMIDRAIIQLRESNGLAGIDDPLEGEDDSIFLIVRRMLDG